jgi:hypothetical protein
MRAVALATAVGGGGALSKIEPTSLLDMSGAQEAMPGRLGDRSAAELASHASGTLSPCAEAVAKLRSTLAFALP